MTSRILFLFLITKQCPIQDTQDMIFFNQQSWETNQLLCYLPRCLEFLSEGIAPTNLAKDPTSPLEGESESGDGLCTEVVVEPVAVALLEEVEEGNEEGDESLFVSILLV